MTGPQKHPITRRTLLASGAAGALAAGLLPRSASSAFAVPPNEDGYDLWLRYHLVADSNLLSRYRDAFTHIVVQGNHVVLRSAGAELARGLSGLLGRSIPVRDQIGKSAVVVGTKVDNTLGPEGFTIKRRTDRVEITGAGERGALYGAFRFLQQLQRQRPLERLDLTDRPASPLRMLNHWDNLNRSIERGYAGKSIFVWDELPGLRERYVDYARLLASVGINHTVINNVNASAEFLRSERLPGLAALAGVLRSWGVRLWLSANYAAPITLTADQPSPITVADPLDTRVQQWWQDKIDEIYRLIPDFGGFLVKANSEGQPGPLDYGRTHAEGANMLADRLAAYDGKLVWRSFVHEGFDDWAEYEYRVFHPLDGQFHANAVVQTKNGPIDFQVREPVNPLFGGLPRTNQMIELQVTQEYTGHSTHLCYLVPEWKSILGFQTHTGTGSGPTVADIVTGLAYDQENVGMAGVVNLGDDRDWTGYQLGAANTHGFARLAWNPKLSADEIVTDWIELTFGGDRQVVSVLKAIMLRSWSTYESYTSPLGMGYLTYPLGSHFAPAPTTTQNLSHHTTAEGTGFDRTAATGSGFTGLYAEHWQDIYGSLANCPDELLLFMHWVPYTHRLRSGKTMIQHIYDSHFDGYERVVEFRRAWGRLAGRVDQARYADIAATFDAHVIEAERWRDTIVSYFYGFSRIVPTGTGWLQLAYPSGQLLFGGRANSLAVEVTNASSSERSITAAVHPVDSGWQVGAASATVGAGAAATVALPVTPPLIADHFELAIDIAPAQMALSSRNQTFVVTPDAAQCHLALDIGTADSPLVTGYARVSPSTTWDTTRGYGWVGTAPQGRDRGSTWDALRRDFCGDYPARTLRITLPPGPVRLSALVGDGGPDCPPTIIAEGNKVLATSTDLPGGIFTWLHADLDGGPTGRTADLILDSEPDRFWHLGALVLT
ncbi:alpha-glucuronidase family glycosyl hydrolase [Kribbella soli]|uniref:Xylan alpha-1,2-glucuronidase n=1 Tax=Kribbella soli TaxID=1124743 RepID=A0A4R0H8I3_9ACTN|nr:alpha-glucuronidase family glycosyl hydrolase [Kribbella soli]TCC07245.1 glycoside hydrolase [Kribbella soli]